MPTSINNPYEHAASAYLKHGWSPIPTGNRGQRAAKSPVPKGYTGRNAEPVTLDQTLEWSEAGYAVNNVAVHVTYGFIGIDVDDYSKTDDKGKTVVKSGADTLAEMEAKIGKLPPTVRSTARGVDNPSGIRFYRVPLDREFITKLDGIEIIQAKHRYAVVWPSVHPKAGNEPGVGRYEWYAPGGRRLGRVPNFDKIPELPALWVERLSVGIDVARTGATAEQLDLTRDEVIEFLDTYGTGNACRAVRGVLRSELTKLEAADAGEGNRYDTAVEGAWAIVRLITEGHLGSRDALYKFGKAYRDAVRDEPGRDPTEWGRMVNGAVSKAMLERPPAEGDDDGFEDNGYSSHNEGDCPERDPKSWPAPAAPLDVARRYVAEHWMQDGVVTLRHWREQFYRFNGRHYEAVSDTALQAELGALLHDVEYVSAAAVASVLRWNPTPQKLKAVMGMLPSVPGVLRPDDRETDDLDPSVIALRNGLLDVETRSLKPLTPDYFALHVLPFDYDPDASCPEWSAFLESLWANRGDCVDLLQEWFGLVLSGSTKLHKMMMLLGPPRSGKGTITRVLESLVGRNASAAITFDAFGQNFGLQPAVDKTLITIPDARFDGRNQSAVVERLLSISGGDTIVVDRKNKDPYMGRLGARIMVVSNELPMLRESSGALMARFVGPLEMTESFLDREDHDLEDRLLRELPGIFVWSLEGLEALAEQEWRFTMPVTSKESRREWVELNSPVESFVEQKCVLAKKASVSTEELYDAYHAWALDEGMKPTAKARFMRDLRATLGGKVTPTRSRESGFRAMSIVGLKLA